MYAHRTGHKFSGRKTAPHLKKDSAFWPNTGPAYFGLTTLEPALVVHIKDGKAYLLDRDNKYGDYMRCFDMETGKELWKYGYEAPGTVELGSRSVLC
jgi:outer membrane protein assembly factor BamB